MDEQAVIDHLQAHITRLSHTDYWNDADFLLPTQDGHSRRSLRFIELVPLEDRDDGLTHAPMSFDGVIPSHAAWESAKAKIEQFYQEVTAETIDQHNWSVLEDSDARQRVTNEKQRPGFVYIIQAGNLYKIGVSSNPEQRRNHVKSPNGCSNQLLFKTWCKNCYDMEFALHKYLADHRVSGEWFVLDKTEVRELIVMLGAAPNDSSK